MMTLKFDIRPETKDDFATIRSVNDLAFKRSDEGCLVELLRQRPGFDSRLSLVALISDGVIGHALFYPIYIQGLDSERFPCLSLGPIAVIPDYQKKGIGGRLIEAGHQAAKTLNYSAVVLLGHPSFYSQFGYKPAQQWDLTNPWGITGDPWMAIELIEGALLHKAGQVVYPEAFNQVS